MKMKRLMMLVCVAALTACVFCVPAYAANGDVAGAIEGTWYTASGVYSDCTALCMADSWNVRRNRDGMLGNYSL